MEALDQIGLILTLCGFVIGLGAVFVIDVHSFLARTSPYWTEATTRTHKITKPLIWTGLLTTIAGSAMLYRDLGFTGYVPLQALLALVLIVNGLYLTFWISPLLLQREQHGRAAEPLPQRLQRVLLVSFLLSFVCWWTELALFAAFLAERL